VLAERIRTGSVDWCRDARGEEGLKEIKLEQSVVINLPAAEIFAYVADFDNLVEWSGIVIAVRKTTPGVTKVGTMLRNTMRFLGRWMESTYEVVECEPDHHITLKSTSGVAPCLFCYLFEPVEGGGTRVSQEAVIRLSPKGGFLGLTEPVVTGAANRQVENDLLTLKDLLEAST
jgi:uncharacterized membrane protein